MIEVIVMRVKRLTGGQEQTARWLLTTQLAVEAQTPLEQADTHLKFWQLWDDGQS